MTSPADSVNAPATAASSAGGGKALTQLGQNEFMKLMLAQLKNQDPFKPTDPATFLGQLAQFSAAAGIENMYSAVSGLADSLRSTQILSGTHLVGREVLAETGQARIEEAGGQVHGAVEVPAGAGEVQIHVRDGAGQLVRRMTLSHQTGINAFVWDGLTDSGVAAPAGSYTFEILASLGGESVSLQPRLAARVQSVTFDPARGALELNTTLGAIALRDVRQVM